jgi:hypothetical protein
MYCCGGIVANVVMLPGKISCNSSTESVGRVDVLGRVWSQEAASYKALRSPTGFNTNIKRENTLSYGASFEQWRGIGCVGTTDLVYTRYL